MLLCRQEIPDGEPPGIGRACADVLRSSSFIVPDDTAKIRRVAGGNNSVEKRLETVECRLKNG